MLDEELKVKTL